MVKQVQAAWLSDQIRSVPESLLLLDTRSPNQIAEGCVTGAVSVYCCGAIILRRLKKGNANVESLLSNEDDKEKMCRARENEDVAVVVYDHGSYNPEELQSDSLAAILLRRLSRECRNVCFLSGGFLGFQQHCPNLCDEDGATPTDSLLKSRPSSLVLQLQSLAINGSDSDSSQSPDSDGSEPSTPAAREIQPFKILPYLYLGCRRVASNVARLKESGVTRILNVTSEASECQHLPEFAYQQISVEDSHEVNMLQHLPRAFAFIEEARHSDGKVLVHCHAGMSRSVTVIIAYLMKYHDHTLNSAYDHVKKQKSNISPNFSFLKQLLEFEGSLRPSPADSGIGSVVNTPVDGHSCSQDVFDSPSLTPRLSQCVLLTT